MPEKRKSLLYSPTAQGDTTVEDGIRQRLTYLLEELFNNKSIYLNSHR